MSETLRKPPPNKPSVCTLMLLAMRKIISQQLNSLSLRQADRLAEPQSKPAAEVSVGTL